jgi:hypothetical protein
MDLRTELNAEFRTKNPLYAKADDKFSGNRTTERLLNQGADMALTMKANRYLGRDFGKLTPSQQERVRVGFERNLAERALGKAEGAGAANQFSTGAFKLIVNTLYPKGKGSAAIQKRGESLIENMKREAITTRGGARIFSNSNTAPTNFDIKNTMLGPEAAIHAATLDARGLFHDLQKWAARRVGQQKAAAFIKMVSEMDPAAMLNHLERLKGVAKNDNEAQIYADLMRSARRKILERAIVGGGLTTQHQTPQ